MAKNVPEVVGLPLELVKELRQIKPHVSAPCYLAACELVVALDQSNLLDDQIGADSTEDRGILFQWPNYGVFLELVPSENTVMSTQSTCEHAECWIQAVRERNQGRHAISNPATALAEIKGILSTFVDANDPYDAYLKSSRNAGNSIVVSPPF
jgi:hypothetical protein